MATPQESNSQIPIGSINGNESLSIVQQDGKIISIGADIRNGLWTLKRLLPTGELDESFGVHGIVELSLRSAFYMLPYVVKIDPEGKILIAGGIEWNHSGSTTRDFIVYRINTDGSRDTSFGPEGMRMVWFDDIVPGADAAIHSLALQSDGKIILAGGPLGMAYLSITDPGPVAGRSSFYVARLNSNGTLDTGFNASGKLAISSLDGSFALNDSITGIAIQKDGKIVYTGSRSRIYSHENTEIGRLNPDGTFDASFGTSGNGRIMLGGSIGTTNYSSNGKDTLLIDNNCSIVIAGDTFATAQQFSSKNTYDYTNQNVFVARILSGLEGIKCKGYKFTIPTDFHYNW